jgi:hypothetical protein
MSSAAATSLARVLLLTSHHFSPRILGVLLHPACSVKELYSNLPPDQQGQLSGPSGAAQLKAAGYTAAALQEGATPGTFSTWDLKLAGYQVAATSSCPEHAPAASGSAATTAAVGSISPRSPRTSRFQAAVMQARQLQQHAPAQAGQHQQGSMVSQAVGGGQQDVQYFRHQVVPLMQMQPEQDVPPLLLGFKVKRTAAATMLCLAGPSLHAQNSRIARPK